MNTKQLFAISRYAYQEAFLQQVTDSSGANAAKMMEKMEKDPEALKKQARGVKILVSVYLLVMVTIPVGAFFELTEYLGTDKPVMWGVFVTSIIISLFFAIQMV